MEGLLMCLPWVLLELHLNLREKAMERQFWIILWKRLQRWDLEQFFLREISDSIVTADLIMQASLESDTMIFRRAQMPHFSYVEN